MFHFLCADEFDEVVISRHPVLNNIVPDRQSDIANLGRLLEDNIALLANFDDLLICCGGDGDA